MGVVRSRRVILRVRSFMRQVRKNRARLKNRTALVLCREFE